MSTKHSHAAKCFCQHIAAYCAYPGRYELHVWYPKSFPSHSSAPSYRYPSPQYACLHSVVRRDTRDEAVTLYVLSNVQLGCYYRSPNMTTWLTDAAVGDNPVSVIALLPTGNLHYPITTVTFIVRCVFHGLERCKLEWKSLLQSLKNVSKKKSQLEKYVK